MITRLHLKGFQCHEDRVFDLDAITVLVGDNDAGKSAVLRALKWLCLNEWDGQADEMITWGIDASRVEGVVDGVSIVREKAKDSNLYVLGDQELRAFHPNVPPPIAHHLKITQDNFQDQSDPAFWLLLTGGQAASALNEIFNLSAVDEALSFVASELRQARSREQVIKERLTEAKQRNKELLWVKQADRELRALEELHDKLVRAERAEQAIQRLTSDLEAASEQLSRLQDVLQTSEGSLKVGERVRKKTEEIDGLKEILSCETELSSRIESLQRKQRLLSEMLGAPCPLCGK